MSTSHRIFHAAGYPLFLLKSLKKLWVSGQFCDVTIAVDDKTFSVHKNVLAAASPYFSAMFTMSFTETEGDVVNIQSVSSDVFSVLLKFIYTGSLELSEDNCQDILAAADMFRISDLMEICCDFLKDQLHPMNCIGIYMFADRYSCVELKEFAESYILSHFLDVIQEEEYSAMPKELLVKFLHSENLQIESEFQVFTAAMKWIFSDLPKRRIHIFSVLEPVRFPIISNKQLQNYIVECSDISLKVALKKLTDDFSEGKRLSYEAKLSRYKPVLLQPRKCARKKLYVIGGYNREPGGRWSDSQTLKSGECFNTFDQQWTDLPQLNHARSGHGVCTLNGTVYVIGGENDSLILDNAECFDPATNKWTEICDMTVPRCGLGVCVVDCKIYAIGGWVGAEIGGTIERFDPDTNRWSMVDSMQTVRFGMGVVEHEGCIYIIGGQSDLDEELRTVECYNTVTGHWSRLASLKVERASMGVALLDQSIYVVGGWNQRLGPLSSIERYSIEDNAWYSAPQMMTPRAGASVAVVNGLLYAIGGRATPTYYSSTETESFTAPFTLNSVECFDPRTKTWFEVNSMPTGRCDAGVAVM